MKRATDRTLLGNLLLEHNLISQGDLDRAISLQKSTHQQLGEILVAQHLVTSSQISRLLKVQRKLRATLLTTLLSFAPLAMQGCGGASAASSETSPDSGQTQQSQVHSSSPEHGSVESVAAAPDVTPNVTPDVAPVAASSESPREIRGLQISLQPQSQRVAAGQSVTLNVSAMGTGPLRYQWRHNGIAIPNAITASLTLTRTTEDHSGLYSVTISNDQGSLQSANADIKVIADRSATLTWDPPGRREDGSRLPSDDIKLYRIYHSSEDGLQDSSYEVAANDLSLTLENLPRGIHYFAITAVDMNELESGLSNVVEKRIF